MKKSRFTASQIMAVLRQAEGGRIVPDLCWEMGAKAVAERGVSIALDCRAFGISVACYRYSPKLDEENERMADLLVRLTQANKGCGVCLCFLHLRNIRGPA